MFDELITWKTFVYCFYGISSNFQRSGIGIKECLANTSIRVFIVQFLKPNSNKGGTMSYKLQAGDVLRGGSVSLIVIYTFN